MPIFSRSIGLVWMAILFVIHAAASASVTISFPLEGHYRDGRYMPVRVVVADTPGANSLTLRAEGALATSITLAEGRTDAVVPWLSSGGAITAARWATEGGGGANLEAPLRPLAAGERLVGYTSGDEASATAVSHALFPAEQIVPVRLDASRAPLSPAAAYESLDAVILDPAAATRVDSGQLRTLLAGGMTVAIQSEKRPGGNWPWQRLGPWWVVRYAPVGPGHRSNRPPTRPPTAGSAAGRSPCGGG